MLLRPQDIEKGSLVHKACCGWSAGQEIQHTPKAERKTAKDFRQMEYKVLWRALMLPFSPRCSLAAAPLARADAPL